MGPSDGEFGVINAGEDSETSGQLAFLLGEGQNNLRGKDTWKPSHDALFASNISELLLRSDQTSSRASEHRQSEVEGKHNLDAQHV